MASFDPLFKINPDETEANFSLEEYTDKKGKKVTTVVKTFPRQRSDNFLEVNMHQHSSEASKGVVKFYESSTTGGLLHIRMKFCEQNSLVKVMEQRQGRLWALRELLEMFKSMLTTLGEVHTLRVAHRTIDCANWFVTRKGKCKLGDFGQAKIIKSRETKGTHTIRADPMYASHLLRREEDAVAFNPFAEDVWSLGKIFFEMCVLKIFRNMNTWPAEVMASKIAEVSQIYNCPQLVQLLIGMLHIDLQQRLTCESALLIVNAAIDQTPEKQVIEEVSESVEVSQEREEDREPPVVDDVHCNSCSNREVLADFFKCGHSVCIKCLEKSIMSNIEIVCVVCAERLRVDDMIENKTLSVKTQKEILTIIQNACEERLDSFPR